VEAGRRSDTDKLERLFDTERVGEPLGGQAFRSTRLQTCRQAARIVRLGWCVRSVEFEAIDSDDEEDEDGNLAHCLRHGIDEQVVDEVLREHSVELKLPLQTADFAIAGPDLGRSFLWTVLFDRSFERGDWLRPITGWHSKPNEIQGETGERGQATHGT
jgi:hypothetical protein